MEFVRNDNDRGLLRPPERYEQAVLDADDALRLVRIQEEFLRGFRKLAGLGPAVTLFGSARLPQDHPDCVAAYEVAYRLGKEGLAIVTGGGPGIMEAANRGAKEAGTISVAANIQLPFESTPNPYQDISLTFRYFFIRKVMLVKYARAFIIFPGGFGTLDELFEVLTLIQTEKVSPMPILLYRSSYWQDLVKWINAQLLAERCISPKDLDLFRIVDSVDEAVEGVIQPLTAAGTLPVPPAAG
ncbi:MAG: TIGR00730 family Rossman fold protein [Firmicutes bacterium]|nr:TIGR00730 family Rossman fold protein [Bacillota bacterium]